MAPSKQDKSKKKKPVQKKKEGKTPASEKLPSDEEELLGSETVSVAPASSKIARVGGEGQEKEGCCLPKQAVSQIIQA